MTADDTETDPLFTDVLRKVAPGEHTWADAICEIAAEYGATPDDDECNFVLWEMTAYPVADAEYIRGQIRAFYAAPDKVAYSRAVYDSIDQACGGAPRKQRRRGSRALKKQRRRFFANEVLQAALLAAADVANPEDVAAWITERLDGAAVDVGARLTRALAKGEQS
jgi:truncated hemoglobin YjbI